MCPRQGSNLQPLNYKAWLSDCSSQWAIVPSMEQTKLHLAYLKNTKEWLSLSLMTIGNKLFPSCTMRKATLSEIMKGNSGRKGGRGKEALVVISNDTKWVLTEGFTKAAHYHCPPTSTYIPSHQLFNRSKSLFWKIYFTCSKSRTSVYLASNLLP